MLAPGPQLTDDLVEDAARDDADRASDPAAVGAEHTSVGMLWICRRSAVSGLASMSQLPKRTCPRGAAAAVAKTGRKDR